MHLSYYFLQFLSKELYEKLKGSIFVEGYLQNRYECVLCFQQGTHFFYIKLNLYAKHTSVSFPKEVFKNKKGTYQVLNDLNGLKVHGMKQNSNDRSFFLEFENELKLLFKLHGSRSNLILFEGDAPVDVLVKNLPLDLEIKLTDLDKVRDQSSDAFMTSGGNINLLFPAFDATIKEAIHTYTGGQGTASHEWLAIQEVLQELTTSHFYVGENNGEVVLSFFKPEKVYSESTSAIESCNEYERQAGRIFFLEHERLAAVRFVSNKIKKTIAFLKIVETKLEEIQQQQPYEEIANIIMANLHQIPANSTTVELYDFYSDTQISVKLKRELSPQKNAEVLYRKSKNRKIEIAELVKSIQQKKDELALLTKQSEALSTFTELKPLRAFCKEFSLVQERAAIERAEETLFKRFEVDGFEILVGKNAANNDVLTQQYSYKEDLWLHARDVAGSHVLLKYRSGKKFPKQVIEVAAQLAAYFSKRKTDSLCPVIVTPKKYVRKPKGALAGQVKVEREEVLLVVPKLPNQKN